MEKLLIGFIMDGKAGGIDRYILNFYDSIKNSDIQIDFLTNQIYLPLREQLNKEQSELYAVASLLHPIRQYRQIYDLVQKNGYEKVYFNISTSLAFPAVMAARKAGAKRVMVHSHAAGFDCERKTKRTIMTFLHHLCKGLLCKYATDFYSCSDKAADWLFTKKILKKECVQHVQNTVDVTQFSYSEDRRREIRQKLGIENKFVIGNVGNMLYQKNQLFLIDAFQEVVKKDENTVLVIIGDGILRPEIESRVQRYGLSDRVLLLGRVDASDGYMSAFDVFALPSVFEGMPIVSVEAQCAHLPCVFSDSITRQAQISDACMFLPTNDLMGWADALLSYKGADRSSITLLADADMFDTKKQKVVFENMLHT